MNTPKELELKQILPYLPFCLQVSDSIDHEQYLTGFRFSDKYDEPHEVEVMDRFGGKGWFDIIEYKPLLIPLSEIQKVMPDILKSLSMLDLSDCTFEENEHEEEIGQWWCNAFDGDRVIACLTFDGNAFYIQYWHGTADDTFDLYEPQYLALQKLAEYHLDYQFLIERGFALNKSDYIK